MVNDSKEIPARFNSSKLGSCSSPSGSADKLQSVNFVDITSLRLVQRVEHRVRSSDERISGEISTSGELEQMKVST